MNGYMLGKIVNLAIEKKLITEMQSETHIRYIKHHC